MSPGEGSSIEHVAWIVGAALERHGIRAVLTGGACASLYSGGAYASVDLDFILTDEIRRGELDRAMAEVGFKRRGVQYESSATPLFVEFPAGPLAIGEDSAIRPRSVRRAGRMLRMLSATDSCRDRLSAWYHWNDRQSLATAVEIALRNRVALERIRKWSRSEGEMEKFESFLHQLRRERVHAPRRSPGESSGGRGPRR